MRSRKAAAPRPAHAIDAALEDDFQRALDEASALSFPASDPPAQMGSMLTAGCPAAGAVEHSVTARAAVVEIRAQPRVVSDRGKASVRRRRTRKAKS